MIDTSINMETRLETSYFEPGPNAIQGELCYSGKCKLYKMAYMQGCPHIEVESYWGKGVIVHYLITGITFSWDWKHRNEAWEWAKSRKTHVDIIKSGGKYANS